MKKEILPTTLKDALAAIDAQTSTELKNEIQTKTRDEFVFEQHFGLGLWIRNNFDLWENESLCREVMEYGDEGFTHVPGLRIPCHPDDVSGRLLELYYDSKKR